MRARLLICLFLSACLLHAEPESSNVLTNPGFEAPATGEMPEGWTKGKHYGQLSPGSEYALDTATTHSGMHSLRLVSKTDDIPVIAESLPVEVDAKERNYFSLYLKGSRNGLPARLFIISRGYKKILRESITLSEEWERYAVHGIPGNGESKVECFVRLDLMAEGTLWADDARLSTDRPREGLRYIGHKAGKSPGQSVVNITVGDDAGPLRNINGVCFCYGHGAKTLDPRFIDTHVKIVRNHNILSNFAILDRNEEGEMLYKWKALDASLDSILKTGAVPLMSLCFVPLKMVAYPDMKKIRDSYDGYYLGPPSDLSEWETYIETVVAHCRDRYDISKWYWVFGNEPSVRQFSMGTEEEFHQLYRSTLQAAVRAYPEITIGAASFASRQWARRFIERCGRDGTRLDFVSWHHYGLIPEVYKQSILETREWLNAWPHLADTQMAIDEWNPMLPDGGEHHLSAGNYAAAHAAASIGYMLQTDLAFHTFFIAQSPFRNGAIDSKGVKNPTFNVLQMFGMMGTRQRALRIDDDPYVSGQASAHEDGSLAIMVWYAQHHSDLHTASDKTVHVRLPLTVNDSAIAMYLISATHSNGYNNPERQELERVDSFTREVSAGQPVLTLSLSPNSVALLVVKPGK